MRENFKKKLYEAWERLDNHTNEVYDKDFLKNEIKKLLKLKNATLISHYYVSPEIQSLTEETNGFIGDSLEMAKFGKRSCADILVLSGVRFMGESAKILNPFKKVIMPTLESECSLDLSCNADDFKKFIEQHPEREVVVYINTSAEVKALADFVVTSSIAKDVILDLHNKNKKIIWAPDKYLGDYIQKETSADMLIWDGFCIVHEEFKIDALISLKNKYPRAEILAHPEAPFDILQIADFVGSTSKMIKYSEESSSQTFIVATESNIFYKMQQKSPNKTFIKAPTYGNNSTCKACNYCPWMGLNNLKNLYDSLKNENNEVLVPKDIADLALKSLNKMIDF